MSLNIVGGRVHKRRKKLGLSQMDLAAKMQVACLDITQVTISKMEHGSRRVNDIEIRGLAEALEVSADWISNLG